MNRKQKLVLSLFGIFAFIPFLKADDDSLFSIWMPPLYEPDQILWVAPDGDDTASGTQNEPIATFQEAVNRVAENQRLTPEKSIGVYFLPGLYQVTETTVMNRIEASEERPVIFRSAPGASGKVFFSGMKDIEEWKPLKETDFWATAPETWKERIKPGMEDRLWVTSYLPYQTEAFDREDKKNWGKYFTSNDHLWLDTEQRKEKGWFDMRDKMTWQEFFADDQAQQIARWPNEGFVYAGKALGETEVLANPHRGTVEGIFEASEDQSLGWEKEPNGFLYGYWYFDWAEAYQKIASFTPPQAEGERARIQLEEPYHFYGYRDGLRYYGMNLLCELDREGEYYIDRENQLILWYPPQGTNPNDSLTQMAMFRKPWMLEIQGCRGIVLAGLTFDGSIGGGVLIKDSAEVFFADSLFKRFANDAGHIEGGWRCGFYHCTLENLGCGGLVLNGGNRKELVKAGHFLSNTTVRNFSRIQRTYAPAAYLYGIGYKIEHCDFSESSSSALNMRCNDITVEYNHFHDLVKESDDQGGTDAHYNPTWRGTVLRYNRWERIQGGGTACGVAGIRLDDMISGYHIYGNLFIECGSHLFGAIQIHGGKDTLIEKNLMWRCAFAVSLTPWGDRYLGAMNNPEDKHYKHIQNTLNEIQYDSPLWLARYPELKEIRINPDVNTVKNNIAVDCGAFYRGEPEKIIQEGNVELTLPNATEQELTQPDFLRTYGVDPLPIDEMGVTGKCYLKD